MTSIIVFTIFHHDSYLELLLIITNFGLGHPKQTTILPVLFTRLLKCLYGKYFAPFLPHFHIANNIVSSSLNLKFNIVAIMENIN